MGIVLNVEQKIPIVLRRERNCGAFNVMSASPAASGDSLGHAVCGAVELHLGASETHRKADGHEPVRWPN